MDISTVIAVAGVSSREEKFGHKIFRDLIRAGYNVYGLNPAGVTVLGRRIFRDLSELPVKPDMVITVVHPRATEKIIDDCVKLGIKEVWMQPGSESAPAIERAQKVGIKVTHDACFMVYKGIW